MYKVVSKIWSTASTSTYSISVRRRRNIIQNAEIVKRKNEYKRQQRLNKNQLMEELAKSNLVSTTAKDIVKNMFAKILRFLAPNNDDFKADSEMISELIDDIIIIDDKIYDFFDRSSKILAVLYNPEFSEDVNVMTIPDIVALQNREDEYKKLEKNKILRKMLYDYYYTTHPNERVEYTVDFNPYNFTIRKLKTGNEEVDVSEDPVNSGIERSGEEMEDSEPEEKSGPGSKIKSLLKIMDRELNELDKGVNEESQSEESQSEESQSEESDVESSDESSISSEESEKQDENQGGEVSSEVPSSSSEVAPDPNSPEFISEKPASSDSDDESSISSTESEVVENQKSSSSVPESSESGSESGSESDRSRDRIQILNQYLLLHHLPRVG